jgi:peptidoglycan/xylan/chitin deacetylase (PgdA/CDA1 family)
MNMLSIFLLCFVCSLPPAFEHPYIRPAVSVKMDTADSLYRTTVSFIPWKDIPVLCYHNIRDGARTGEYTISTERFKEHMKLLADSGYHAILPNQLYNYLTRGVALPAHPVMISFDDSRAEHFSIAAPLLEQYGFKGVFFIMTIPLGKPGYLTPAQLKSLAERGHVIGLHTWDHQLVSKWKAADWETQVSNPKAQLEKITGKPVNYFAYPSGVWNESVIPALKQRGIKAAFQLYGRHSSSDKLFTIRRIIVPGSLSASGMLKQVKSVFR